MIALGFLFYRCFQNCGLWAKEIQKIHVSTAAPLQTHYTPRHLPPPLLSCDTPQNIAGDTYHPLALLHLTHCSFLLRDPQQRTFAVLRSFLVCTVLRYDTEYSNYGLLQCLEDGDSQKGKKFACNGAAVPQRLGTRVVTWTVTVAT